MREPPAALCAAAVRIVFPAESCWCGGAVQALCIASGRLGMAAATRLMANGHCWRKLRACVSAGIRQRRVRMSASTVCLSKRRPQFFLILSHESMTIRSTPSVRFARSSSVMQHQDASSWYASPSVAIRFGSSMHASRIATSVEIMKKTPRKSVSPKRAVLGRGRSASADDGEMREHYDFDYSKSRPNRFAAEFAADGTIAVVLEPDVAKVFDSAEAVNTFLRSAIEAMPAGESRKKQRTSERRLTRR